MLFCYDQIFCYSRERASERFPFLSFSFFLFFFLGCFSPFFFFSSLLFLSSCFGCPLVALTFVFTECVPLVGAKGPAASLPAAPGWLPHERGDKQGAPAFIPFIPPPMGMLSRRAPARPRQPIMLQSGLTPSSPSLPSFLPSFSLVTLRSPAREGRGDRKFLPHGFFACCYPRWGLYPLCRPRVGGGLRASPAAPQVRGRAVDPHPDPLSKMLGGTP